MGFLGGMAKEKCAMCSVSISDALWFTCAQGTLRLQADFCVLLFGSTPIGENPLYMHSFGVCEYRYLDLFVA